MTTGPPRLLLDGLHFGEGPRWHDGRLWYSDFFQGGVFAVGIDGTRERICTVPGHLLQPRCTRERRNPREHRRSRTARRTRPPAGHHR